MTTKYRFGFAAFFLGLVTVACEDSILLGGRVVDDIVEQSGTGGTTTVGHGSSAPSTTAGASSISKSTRPHDTAPSANYCCDGQVGNGEQCDDGNRLDQDGCSATCTIEAGYTCNGQESECKSVCGDGVVAPNEQCDDGNAINDDGCSAACQSDPGYKCLGQPSDCISLCGDGIVTKGEECDDGPEGNQDEYGTCRKDCTQGPRCGDAILQASQEQCDDGNGLDNDGCSSGCQIEAGYTCNGQQSECLSVCGDGIVAKGEQCDLGAENNSGGYGTCNSDCTLGSYCGDGVVQTPQEECDLGAKNGTGSCSTGCRTVFLN